MIGLVLAFLILLPSQVLADSAISLTEGLMSFDVPLTDKSMVYLGQLFGNVGSLVHGNNLLLAHVFVLMNVAMWIFAGIIASYFLVKSVIKTAVEGKILGEQGNYWLAARTIAGVVALLPKFTGYSFVQVVVMWAVVQGIGLADQTWNAALDYFQEGGTFYNAQLNNMNTNGTAALSPVEREIMANVLADSATMLNAAVCMYSLQQQDIHYNKVRNLPPPIGFNPFTVEPGYLMFGDTNNPSACGTYVLNDAQLTSDAVIKSAALSGLAIEIMSLAQHIVNSTRVTDNQPVVSCSDCVESDVLASIAQEYLANVRTSKPLSSISSTDQNLQKARNDGWITAGNYYTDMITANAISQVSPYISDYRFQLPSQYQGIIFKDSGSADTIPDWKALSNPASLLVATIPVKQYFFNVKSYYSQAAHPRVSATAANNANLSGQIGNAIDTQVFHHGTENSILVGIGSFGMSGLGAVTHWWTIGWNKPVTAFDVINEDLKAMITGALGAWRDSILYMDSSGQSSYLDPFARSRKLGLQLISLTLTFWQDVTQHTFNILAVSSSVMTTAMILAAWGLALIGMPTASHYPGRDMSVVLNAGMQMAFQIMTSHVFWYLPLGTAISTPLFIIGSTLAAYIPLIPFIVFTFAVIGWFISVLEAMVAAPLVAFGMTHPEGHDVLGKTEQGLMLLMGLFIRPVCMVIGLLVGITLVFLSVELFDRGYIDLILNLMTDSQQVLARLGGNEAFTALVIMMIFLMTYTFILMAIVNQCMTAVYVLPDKIMRWIGLPPESSGVGAMVEQTKSGTESKMGEGAHGGAGMGGDMRHAGAQPVSAQSHGDQPTSSTLSQNK